MTEAHLRVDHSEPAKSTKSKLKTHVHIVLDRSGSMQSCHRSTVDGFNEYLNTLRNDKDGDYFVTLTQFDSGRNGPEIEQTFSDLKLKKVRDLTLDDFKPRGMTPLLDAIGISIRETEENLSKKKGTNAVVLVIITDGGENSSREFKTETIKKMIDKKEADGWTVAYLGANQDAFAVGSTMGFKSDKTMTYRTDQMGQTFRGLAETTVHRRSLYSAATKDLTEDASDEAIRGLMSTVASSAFFDGDNDATK